MFEDIIHRHPANPILTAADIPGGASSVFNSGLIRHDGKVLSTDAILTRVWGPEWIGEPDLVKQYIYRLRRKIEPDVRDPRYLHTVRGGGYYFDAEDLL